jgi:hypothetical protein
MLDVSSRRSEVGSGVVRGLICANSTAGVKAPAVLFREAVSVTTHTRAVWLVPRVCPRCEGEHMGDGRLCPRCLSTVHKLRRAQEKSNAVQERAKYRRERGL